MTPARKPKSRASAILGTGAALLVASYVLAETIPTEDPVVVVGRRPDGFVLTCATAFCFDAVQEEAARALLEWQRMYAELPPDDLPLDGERFCQLLAADKPRAAASAIRRRRWALRCRDRPLGSRMGAAPVVLAAGSRMPYWKSLPASLIRATSTLRTLA